MRQTSSQGDAVGLVERAETRLLHHENAMADLGQRVAELYQQLSFPSAPRLQSALRKEGITLSLCTLKEITSESGARQVLQPPPRYGGHITSSRVDDRWAADLLSFESRPAKRGDATYTSVLFCQDIFSRFVGRPDSEEDAGPARI